MPAPMTHLASASSSVSSLPLAPPSKMSSYNPSEQGIAHIAAIYTADKGNHVSSREDESQVDLLKPSHTSDTVCIATQEEKRRRVAQRRDPSEEREPEDCDDEVDIVVDTSRRTLKVKGTASTLNSKLNSTVPTSSTQRQLHTHIVCLHRDRGTAAHSVTYKRRPVLLQTTARRNKCDSKTSGIVFCCVGSAAGVHGLAKTSPAAAEPNTPLRDSGASVTTSGSELALDLKSDFDVSMGLMDSDADVDRVIDDEVIVPSAHASYSPPFLCSSGMHDRPNRPLWGFMIPKHDNFDTDLDAGTFLDHAHASPDRGLDVRPTSLSAGASSGEEWVDWCAGHILSATSVSMDNGAGEYAADRTIGLSVLGGGISPSKVDDTRALPLVSLGKGKGETRAPAVDVVLDSPQSVGAPSELEYQVKHDMANPRAQTTSAPVPIHLDASPM
ncbi:hypothetical protein V8E53_005786 [Lactarius tabidus]